MDVINGNVMAKINMGMATIQVQAESITVAT